MFILAKSDNNIEKTKAIVLGTSIFTLLCVVPYFVFILYKRYYMKQNMKDNNIGKELIETPKNN